ncbi:hypothetical protein SUGI_0550320 [Cryptomeria japonica]|uniref:inactive leucine-rich repeat receptor-like serine/threonine-protein kinase At1g60630 n=1 Tax=Cryptomeria japonica TaxID=3369 RepID=UPI002408A114|nr:inactive leucine-rich repeat receptor-like serine/threonine-protein kinase At1g60630 [Cryptomeria japonica]GLJ28025.1 hypothetical protein SUGI_0550320 [Cryptomeria japonica]
MSKALVWVPFFMLFVVQTVFCANMSQDAVGLLRFKASADAGHMLDRGWRSRNYCRWIGVVECTSGGRVIKLVLEKMQLNGTFAENSLNKLDQLRILSLKGNSLTGPIPDLSGLVNLKSLFLDHNMFSGSIPGSLTSLHRLKIIVLSYNLLSGEIPEAMGSLPRLYALQLDNNRLNGTIPAFNQSAMKVFNVSDNELSGPIPSTAALSSLNSSSFLGNPRLCGSPLGKRCHIVLSPPSQAPVVVISSPIQTDLRPLVKTKKKISGGKIAGIVVGSSVGLLAMLFVVFLLSKKSGEREEETQKIAGEKLSTEDNGFEQFYDKAIKTDKPKSGVLMFCGGETQMYTLEDLLRASAEVMGRGTVGTTYKAVMENKTIVTVKRLKNSNKMNREEFERHMEMVGKLRHENIVPLRAYFQAKEERLLVYDNYPNGSLFSLIHGARSQRGKSLHWTSCLKIAEDIACGLAYLHQASRLIHGNLKSTNVLMGQDFEACITDYGLTVFDIEQPEDSTLLGYKAPECMKSNKKMGPKSDVFSFGVLLLELLTGKVPLQSFLNGQAMDLQRWVRSVREEELTSGVNVDGSVSANETSEDRLIQLLNISMACVATSPERRPTMRQVLRMIEEVKETLVVSSQSEESPKWYESIHGSTPQRNATDRD